MPRLLLPASNSPPRCLGPGAAGREPACSRRSPRTSLRQPPAPPRWGPADRLRPAKPAAGALVPGGLPSVARNEVRVGEIPVPLLLFFIEEEERTKRRPGDFALDFAPSSSPCAQVEITEAAAVTAICPDDIGRPLSTPGAGPFFPRAPVSRPRRRWRQRRSRSRTRSRACRQLGEQ